MQIVAYQPNSRHSRLPETYPALRMHAAVGSKYSAEVELASILEVMVAPEAEN